MKIKGELEYLPNGQAPAFSFPDIPRKNRARIYYDYKRGSARKSFYADGTIEDVNEFVGYFVNNPADWNFVWVFVVYYYGKIAQWDINTKCWWVSDKSGNYFFDTPITPNLLI